MNATSKKLSRFRRLQRECGRPRGGSVFKSRRLAVESIENRLLLAVGTNAGTSLALSTSGGASSNFVDISSLIEFNHTNQVLGDGHGCVQGNIDVFDSNQITNAWIPCGNNGFLRIDTIALPAPIKTPDYFDISFIAESPTPSKPIEPAVSKDSAIAGPQKPAFESMKTSAPLSVDGIRGRCQVLEVAQSAANESKPVSAVHPEIGSKEAGIAPAGDKAKLSSDASGVARSAVSTAFAKTGENIRETALEMAKDNRSSDVNAVFAGKAEGKTTPSISSDRQAVSDEPLVVDGKMEGVQSAGTSEKIEPAASKPLEKPESRSAALPECSEHRESPAESAERVFFAKADENSTISKPLPFASEDNFRFKTIGLAVAAVAAQFAVPGWRHFLPTDKTHQLPPRRQKTAK
jgi:hypothetical protein